MRNEFVLSKQDSICKTCGGIGVLSFISGMIMCLLCNITLMPVGLILFNLGVVMLTEVFVYLFEIKNITFKFANSISILGVSVSIIGTYCLFANIIPAILCLITIGIANVMMLLQRYK